MSTVTVRLATADDVLGIARVHVQAWQETYRGMVDDRALDSPNAVARRAAYWATVIEDGADGTEWLAVAERAGEIIGIASSGIPHDEDATWPSELFVLYVLAEAHGTGVGARLLDAVLGTRSASLWVADPNPRAQAFYRKSGFVADGLTKDEGIAEIRMVRA